MIFCHFTRQTLVKERHEEIELTGNVVFSYYTEDERTHLVGRLGPSSIYTQGERIDYGQFGATCSFHAFEDVNRSEMERHLARKLDHLAVKQVRNSLWKIKMKDVFKIDCRPFIEDINSSNVRWAERHRRRRN